MVGVTAMMVTLSVFYNIPRCDFKLFFLLRSDQCCGGMNGGAAIAGSMNSVAGMGRASNADPERIRLQTAGARSGPKYTQHLDDPEEDVSYRFDKEVEPGPRIVPQTCSVVHLGAEHNLLTSN